MTANARFVQKGNELINLDHVRKVWIGARNAGTPDVVYSLSFNFGHEYAEEIWEWTERSERDRMLSEIKDWRL